MSIPTPACTPQRGQTRSRAPPVPPGQAYGSRRSTGKIVVLFEHDVTGRTRAPVANPMGGN